MAYNRNTWEHDRGNTVRDSIGGGRYCQDNVGYNNKLIANIRRIDERENKVQIESGSQHLDHIPVVYQHDQDRHGRSNKLKNVSNNTPHKKITITNSGNMKLMTVIIGLCIAQIVIALAVF